MKTELNEAVTLAPGFADATLLLADLNIQSGAVQPAIEDLERFLARQPNAAPALVLLGSAHLAGREPARATEVYRRLVTLALKDPRAVHLVGVGLLAQGKRAEGRKELQPRLAGPYLQLDSLHAASGQYDQALARVGKAIEVNPRNVGALMLARVIHEKRGDIPKAREHNAKVLALNPRFAPAANNLA